MFNLLWIGLSIQYSGARSCIHFRGWDFHFRFNIITLVHGRGIKINMTQFAACDWY